MSILMFIVIVVLIGVGMWAVNTYIPMAPPIKTFLNIAVVILLIIWLLSILGLLPALNQPIGTVK